MKTLKRLGAVLGIYIGFVVVFETGYLGLYQPSFEESGIPMLLLTTTDADGEADSRMLALFAANGEIYVSAHHWIRGWYHRARSNPEVTVRVGDGEGTYIAVPITGDEFDQVAVEHPLRFPTRFLMGFPPPRDILRLDPI